MPKSLTKQIKFISPNIYELKSIAQALGYQQQYWDDAHLLMIDDNNAQLLMDIKRIASFVNDHIENVIVTLGSAGIFIVRRQLASAEFYDAQQNLKQDNMPIQTGTLHSRFYKANIIKNIVNVSGAGDSFTSGFVAAMLKGHPENICVSVGFEAAGSALRSQGAVPNEYFDFEHLCWKTEATFKDII